MFDRNEALLLRYQEVMNRLGSLNGALGGLAFDNEIVKAVRKCLKPLGVRVKHSYSDVADHEQVIVSSYYDPSDDDVPYEVWLTFKSKGQFSHFHSHINQLKYDIADSLVHEYVHHLQYLNGACTSDPDTDQAYLADDIELDAYAVNCSYELVRNLKSNAIKLDELITLSRKPRPSDCPFSFTLWQYGNQFSKDSQIWQRFLKKTYKNVSWLVSQKETCL